MSRPARFDALRAPTLLVGLVLLLVSCSGNPPGTDDGPAGEDAGVAQGSSSAPLISAPTTFNAGPADASRSVVQRAPRVETSRAESSLPLRSLPDPSGPAPEVEHEVRFKPRTPRATPLAADPVLQASVPITNMPAAVLNFKGQGNSTSKPTVTGTPPDTNGAVGPNHFVQTVNGGIAVWNKSGTIVAASKLLGTLWTGYVGTNPGNACAKQNDGDPVVVYDQLADRWFITQFSLPNQTAPSFQCVAVSKTADPTGAYWLYDYKYDFDVNDYGKFGIWPDAYYATFNGFDANFVGADLCAYDRVSMLKGAPATQQCFAQGSTAYGVLPISLDGKVPPPRGEPGFFMQLGEDASGNFNDTLQMWKLHVDFATPANSALTGPTSLPVAAYTSMCDATGTCVPQGGGATLDSLGDRLMFRLSYRNFGTHESVLVNHSVTAGTTGGIRWYEIRSPNATPTLFQSGTYAPADTSWRWMGSIAQDQAQNFALGFSIASTTKRPSIAWTGRLVGDTAGTMGQGETVFDTGSAGETGATRWGDYSNMTVDPSDDCTFWYTQELYATTGTSTWDTQIATVKFPSCAANDFSLALAPATRSLPQGGQVTYTVTTTSTAGTAESIALNVQDLPSGVTGAFVPAAVTAGAASVLTLTATASAPVTATPTTFTVIGKAPSAVHAATAQVSVTACVPITTCGAGNDCGTLPDGCGGTLSCGTCAAGAQCVANKCVGGGVDGGADGGVDGGADAGHDSGTPDSGAHDSGTSDSGARDSGPVGTDSGSGSDSGGPIVGGGDASAGDASASDGSSDDAGSGGGSGDGGGCSCRTTGARTPPPEAFFGAFGLSALGVFRRRRRRASR